MNLRFRPSCHSILSHCKRMTHHATGELELYTQKVKLDLSSGEIAEIDAVYQDTLPAEGSSLSLGTVVTIHGSPGSHNDFKYVVPHLRAAGVRVIGVNFPGLGYSSYDHRMRNNNAERTQFIKRLLAQTGVHKNIVFMGHSRGAENALRMAVNNVNNDDLHGGKVVGLVLVNPIGFKKHKGVRRPWPFIRASAWLWSNSWRMVRRFLLEPFFFQVYKFLGFKAATGKIAGISLANMAETDFQRQRPFVETANQMEHLRSLILHAGRDHLIESERSFEFVSAFDKCEELVCETKEEKESDDDGMIVKEVCQRFTQKHPKNVAVYFPNEDHFLQKHRAKLIGEAIKLLLKSKTDSTNDNSKL